MKPTALFVLGNFGVGKSTLIQPWFGTVEGSTKFTCMSEWLGWEILGTDIGADSLSNYKKADVLAEVIPAKVNTIIAGIYYQKLIDIDRFENTHDIVAIHLNLTQRLNQDRVLGRGGKWNHTTYEGNMHGIKRFKEICYDRFYSVIDINASRPPHSLRESFREILATYA